MEFLVSNILRRLATHVKASTSLERVRRQSGHDRRHHTCLTGGQGRQPDMAESIITGTIYKTRQDSGTRIVVYTTYHVKWERKKIKNIKCTMLLYFFGFLRLFSFHYVQRNILLGLIGIALQRQFRGQLARYILLQN